MILRLLFALCFLISGFSATAGIIDVQKRPLRVLNVESEVYVFIEGDLRKNTTYQDGKSVLVGMPPFDDKKAYCHVEDFSLIPDHENRKTPLRLNEIEGFVVDEGQNDTWTKFITKLHFMGTKADLSITCFSESKGLYREITLGEFEQTFGINLRYGNLSLGDSGVEIRNPLYGEYDVLTAEVLRKYIQLSTLEPIKLIKDKENSALRVTVAGGKILETNDYSIPYCDFLHIPDKGSVPDELILPKGLKLTFGAVTGSYHKSKLMDHGFILMADLIGYEKSLRLYCSSNDPNKPLRYLGARYITQPLIDWSYTF